MSFLDDPWNEKFKEMMKYKETHGHLTFTKSDISSQQLGRWVRKQREYKKKGRLRQCRIDKLDSVNFDWDARERTWNESFQDYEDFVRTNGISGVPKSRSHLSYWMSNQRKAYRNGLLKAPRVKLLNNIGFCWVLKGDAEQSPSVGSGVAPAVSAPAVGASAVGAPAVGAPAVGAPADSAPADSAGVPVEYYVEDIAWRQYALHTSDVSNLSPLPPPAPLPPFISDYEDTSCTWHMDKVNSILRVNLKHGMNLSKEAKEYLYVMMERDDIAVITSGLYHGMGHECWNQDRMAHELGADRYHSFRRFAYIVNPATGCKEYQEIKKDVTMTIGDYFAYLKRRGSDVTLKDMSHNTEIEEKLYLINSEGQKEELDMTETIYMLDFPMETQLPAAYNHFMKNFLFPEILPGGERCAMHTVPRTARPDMGPNLYMTPPGAFTHFHQDGFGTVDSGHLCLSGYNEVILLRRLPKGHDRNAMLNALGDDGFKTPHYNDEEEGMKLCKWPGNDEIMRMKALNYCPVVLVLGPGEHLHIGKGRFHAFRKLGLEALAKDDCHSYLRKEILRKKKVRSKRGKLEFKNMVNFSIAWDWSFMGHTAEGINREMTSALESAFRNRNFVPPKQSLGIPKLCLLKQCAQSESHLSAGKPEDPEFHRNLLQGLLPTLEFVIRHEMCMVAEVFPQKLPNTSENLSVFPVDPYDNAGYSCSLCYLELSNTYMHCWGCEQLLQKDFNVCSQCYGLEMHRRFHVMNINVDAQNSAFNHTGAFGASTAHKGSCDEGHLCPKCTGGQECCCTCHSNFSIEQRFFSNDGLSKLLSGTRKIVGMQKIPFFDEVSPRLQAVENFREGALPQMTKSTRKVRKMKVGSTHASVVRKKRK